MLASMPTCDSVDRNLCHPTVLPQRQLPAARVAKQVPQPNLGLQQARRCEIIVAPITFHIMHHTTQSEEVDTIYEWYPDITASYTAGAEALPWKRWAPPAWKYPDTAVSHCLRDSFSCLPPNATGT